MADKTKRTLIGIVLNVLVKIDKFIFPIDFIVRDMVEDPMMPLILGRPLLAKSHVQIDVFNKQISLKVVNERILFKTNENVDKHLICIQTRC